MKITVSHIGEIKLQTLRNTGQRCLPSTNRRYLGQPMVAAFAGPSQAAHDLQTASVTGHVLTDASI